MDGSITESTLTCIQSTEALSSRSIRQRLDQIDWTFNDRSPAPKIEAIHPYPAKFIGDIPRALIQCLPIPSNSAVLDPFCGSGTTLIEAQRAGLDAVGIDLNPIACLISRVKTQPLVAGFDKVIDRVLALSGSSVPVAPSNIPNVGHWFTPDVQKAVGAIAHVISGEEFEPWRDALRLVLSSILVRVSNQDSDTRYAAVDKNVSYSDVFDAFSTSAMKLQRALLDRTWPQTTAKVIEGNTLEVHRADIGQRIGLVITSPPYPNAYEYWLYHKYRMWWLGFDPIAVKDKEIGARAHFFKKNHHTPEIFFEQMSATLKLISEVLVDGGYVCFVVGRSKIHGVVVDNGDIIERAARQQGMALVSRFERLIKSSRKSFNLSHANIKTESVIILRTA